ncbi:MAG TPA: FAD-dependent oxidoreductase, partial [Thermohalobaculum sp.]|nr:FAD-dependent oxidoreductase [Thermohalobaculum sp.]
MNIQTSIPIDFLRASLRGKALSPGESGYDDARALWNAMIDRHPVVIVRAEGPADVAATVDFARKQGLPVSIKGGGHNVAGHAVCDGGVMIDLSLMRGVRVDPEARRAHVQGGATWGDVDSATQAHGLATPGGLISDTGVAGLTLSGGIGWLRSRHGLCIDNLVSMQVVTADGKLVTASADSHSDLYWALRGGGGNFGVVVDFEFALHPLGPTVMFCAPIYPISAGPGPIRFWRDFVADKGDRIGSLVEFSTVAATADFPQEFWGQRCYTIAAVYAGDADEGERVMQPLREQGKLITDFSGQMDYCEVQKLFDAQTPKGQFRNYWKCHYIAEMSDALIDEALANAVANPSDNSISSLWDLGGAVSSVPAEATALGDRSFGWLYSLDTIWPNAADD